MKKIKILVLLQLMLSTNMYGHKSHVHQYISQQAYFFLANEVGSIPVLAEYLGINYDQNCNNWTGEGNNTDPWLSPYPIMVGTWRDDKEDPIWQYQTLDAYNASSGHFWRADIGDYTWSHLDIAGILPDVDVHNAFEKAEFYANGGAFLTLVRPFQVYDNGVIQNCDVMKMSYTSLIDLYQTGTWYLEAYTIAGSNNVVNLTPHWTMTNQVGLGKSIALQLFGRLIHLLEDMSVPAHAHNQAHPCHVDIFGIPIIERGDFFELYEGGNWPSNSNCDDTHTTFPAQNYTYLTALAQGGLLTEIMTMNDPHDVIHYLFYTLNQLADFFPSGNNSGNPGSNIGFIAGNNLLPYGSNPHITSAYGQFGGIPPTTIDGEQIGGVTMNFAIRAVASLYYWFAVRTGMIGAPGSFAGNLKVQNFLLNTFHAPAFVDYTHPYSTYSYVNDRIKMDVPFTLKVGKNVTQSEPPGEFTMTGIGGLWTAGEEIVFEDGTTFSPGVELVAQIIPPCPFPLRTVNPITVLPDYNPAVVERKSSDASYGELIITPNPSRGMIYCSNFSNNLKNISVYDIDGRKIYEINSHENSFTLDLSEKNKGIYLVKVMDGEKVITHKIAIQ